MQAMQIRGRERELQRELQRSQAMQERQAALQAKADAKADALAKSQPKIILNPFSSAPPRPTPPRPTPLSKDDGFYGSPEYDEYRKSTEGSSQSADMQYDPISGEYGSSTLNRAKADAYKKYQQNNPNGLPKITLPPPPRNPFGNPQSSLGQMGQMGQSNSPPTTSAAPETTETQPFKKGGAVKAKTTTKTTSSKASSRGDGIAQRGKTRGKIC
jgi:hypothetical protein